MPGLRNRLELTTIRNSLEKAENPDIEGTGELTTIPNSLGVCDEWWLFRPFNAVPSMPSHFLQIQDG
jgi:hypothetical protein